MAVARLATCFVLFTVLGHTPASLGVILRTTDRVVWANEFEPVELTCFIESTSTYNPRIEWKKIKDGVPSYVYFQNRISGDLEHRAELREPANILIFSATRSDTAGYRCEAVAIDDQKDFDEILISLAVRVKPVVPQCSVPEAVTVGTSTQLRCVENEGFPEPQYRWFRNNEELPQDPKNSPKRVNSSYSINPDTGGLKFRRVRKEDAGEYYCQAENDAGSARCPPQMMEVHDVDVLGISLKSFGAVVAVFCLAASVCYSVKRGCFSKKGHSENNCSGGDFRHTPSFII